MKSTLFLMSIALLLAQSDSAFKLKDIEKFESFDRDPQWEGVNNRLAEKQSRTVKQDFGYRTSNHTGGEPGEIGGYISTAAEPAYYAKVIESKSFEDTLTASGKLIYRGDAPHLLLGFFNSNSINEWRAPNSLAIRLQGRGDVFYAYVEYATSKWRAGGDSPGGFATIKDPASGRSQLKGFQRGEVYPWAIKYNPQGNSGTGSITVTIGNETSICHLSEGHKPDGATFNRFGIFAISKSADGGGEFWFNNITINGQQQDFRKAPGWEGQGNQRTFETTNVRPWFNFGYSASHHAQGKAPGELGGLTFRGDCRYANRMAAYGDKLNELNLSKPLRASGKVAMLRGVTDSTSLIGFYHSQDSMEVNPSQNSGIPKSFLGISIEGPSREGFLVYPMYRWKGSEQDYVNGNDRPHIMPDGKSHDWSLEYLPSVNGKQAVIRVGLDGQVVTLGTKPGKEMDLTRFNRFGLITTWIDGNGQTVFFDDIRYTLTQP